MKICEIKIHEGRDDSMIAKSPSGIFSTDQLIQEAINFFKTREMVSLDFMYLQVLNLGYIIIEMRYTFTYPDPIITQEEVLVGQKVKKRIWVKSPEMPMMKLEHILQKEFSYQERPSVKITTLNQGLFYLDTTPK